MRLRLTYYAIIVLTLLVPPGCDEPAEEATEAIPMAVSPAESTATLAAGLQSDAPPECLHPNGRGLTTRPIVEGHRFEHPIFVTQPRGEDETLYVAERSGRILMVAAGGILRRPFLDIRRQIASEHPEQGLLGLAFHPKFRTNGRFYLHYTPSDEEKNIVAEWALKFDDPYEVRRLVDVDDPHPANNGGMLAFGPDGFLYAGMGDGGGTGDPHGLFGNAQSGDTVLGSILRIDVDAPSRDFAPTDNPYVDKVGHPYIWAKGLRNPWRFSFDTATGALYVADIGQARYEEITVVPPDPKHFLNLGWRAFEGFSLYDDDLADMFDEHTEPAVTYRNQSRFDVVRGGCAVVGGFVYRGETLPLLSGAYLYGDRCSNDIAVFSYCDGTVVGHQRIPELSGHDGGLTSFGRDNDGNLYMTFSNGQVRRIVSD